MLEWIPLQHAGAVMGHSTETQLHTVQVVSCTTAAHTPSTTEYGHAKSCMPLSEDGCAQASGEDSQDTIALDI